MSDEKPVGCPKCGEPVNAEMVATIKSKSTMRMAIHPSPGEFLALTTVGGIMLQMERLMAATSRANGTTSTCLFSDIVKRDDGAIEFEFVVVRPARKRKKPAREAAP